MKTFKQARVILYSWSSRPYVPVCVLFSQSPPPYIYMRVSLDFRSILYRVPLPRPIHAQIAIRPPRRRVSDRLQLVANLLYTMFYGSYRNFMSQRELKPIQVDFAIIVFQHGDIFCFFVIYYIYRSVFNI
jgi:hypothetical protein